MDTDLAILEKYAVVNADDFYEMIDKIDQMEEVSHKDLIETDSKVYYKFTDTDAVIVHQLTFPSPIHVIASLMCELDLVHHWMGGSDQNMKLQIYKAPTTFIDGWSFKMDVPQQGKMQTEMGSVIYIDSKSNGILQVGTSMDRSRGKWFNEDIFALADGHTNQEIRRSLRYVEKVDDNKSKHVMISEFPLSAQMTKEVILEHIIKSMIVDRTKHMYQVYKDTISLYEERVNVTRKDFYDKIKKILDDE